MVELLPCKYCGYIPESHDFKLRHDGFGRTQKRITHTCKDGHHIIKTGWHNTKRDIADEWNGSMS